ncbi:RNA-binding cell elongation regulator Jag/EloR [Bacillus sp. FJAT-45350]|uniref:RNA-binding cell elongation regulator Jag/EloR n=1 Tax=Bacillus sp. FJAT-45350 TaxID=2011014 RepID=UPI000BB85D89|nr:RNA-binding cell elongation regulator Jag/EloR [Bacillus sp. FJAT-45350]
MKKITASGKSIEEAVQKALVELNTTEDRVEINVLENPQKGFFGFIGSKPAVVEVQLKPDAVEIARQFLEETIEKMGVEASVSNVERNGSILFDIKGENIGALIGKRGQTLDSLQYLVNLVANRYAEDYMRIQLDAENYRAKRKEALEQLAERLARKVLKTARPVKLEPMSAHDRKIIHATLQRKKDISTYSEGEEPRRRIVVSPK